MLAGANLRDDQAVAALYRETLKALAVRADAGVLLTHHETKYGRAGGDQAYQGSGQVTAQADTVLTLRQTSPLSEVAESDRVRTRSSVAIRQAKNRPRGAYWTEHVDIAGVAEAGADGRLLELSVALRAAEGDQAPSDLERFLGELTEPMAPGALAKRLGWDRTGDRFRRLTDEALEAGRIIREGNPPAVRLVPIDAD
jgi:hypothetical protein